MGALVVGHEADEIDGFGEGFEVVAAAPLGEDPGAEAGFAGMAGSVGNDVDLDLQVLLVQGVGDLLDEGGEAVAVGPHDVFDVEVDAVVAVLAALAEQGLDHGVLCLRIAEEGV